MLAILYLLAATSFGDIVCRRFLRFDSLFHRLASAFLVGTLLASCMTYVLAVFFSGSGDPLLWANVATFTAMAACVYLMMQFFPPVDDVFSGVGAERPPGDWHWDLFWLAVCFAFGWLLMSSMLTYEDDSIKFTIGTWSDFGANISLAQSFAFGNNFPAEHPFYPGETIRYHFLFWFLAGNLSYLGLNIVWAINIIGILSLAAMLVLMTAFAEKLFHSRAVGRISLIFFFFASSALSYVPFLWSKSSLTDAISSIVARKNPLVSGFPYYGDDWGSLSVISFLNQRHLIPACGILFIVLTYLVDFYRRKGSFANMDPDPSSEFAELSRYRPDVPAMIFCGVLIGFLPYLNSAVLITAALTIGGLFILFPQRRTVMALLITALIVGIPQLLVLRSGNAVSLSQSFLNWGYIVSEPSVGKIIGYVLWTFGLKWLLLAVALWFVPGSHRRLLLALSLPLIAAFSFQFSMTLINNHKLLNVWGLLIAPYLAYAIWIIGRRGIARMVLAAVLTLAVVFGAIVDLFPIYNDGYIATPYGNDRLTNWVKENTGPSEIFLTEMWLSHPILFAGRKVYYGNTLFAWTAGYGGLQERDRLYKQILKTNNPTELIGLLHKNNITYIAVDDGFRGNQNTRWLDEAMLRQNFRLVFDDTEHKYYNLKIYRVP